MATIELIEPIQVTEKSTPITVLNFRKPTLGDLRSLGTEADMGAIIDIASKLCGQPTVVLDKLSMEDAAEVMKLVEGFFESFQKIIER